MRYRYNGFIAFRDTNVFRITMKSIRLQRSEYSMALAIIALISLTISITDWIQRGMIPSFNILLSVVSAILLIYWLPMVGSYSVVMKFKLQRWWQQWLVFYISILVGTFIWGEVRALFLPLQGIGWLQAGLISLPWSVMILISVKFYLSQKNLKVEQQLRKQAEINLLHSQLNPHFLFNSLNTIASFARTQPERCEDLVHDLAAVLRYSLSHSSMNKTTSNEQTSHRVKLSDELVILNKWCDIERSRFGSKLNISFDVDENLLDELVPAMLLQPMLENAIKHGKKQPLQIWVTVQCEGHYIFIRVRDNGVGFPEAFLNRRNFHSSDTSKSVPETGDSTHLGLEITRARLKLESDTTLFLSNSPTGGACVEFYLPTGSKSC